MTITQKDLARMLNVSNATVSLALQDSPEIGAATKRKVRRLAEEKHYRPSQIARSLVMKKTHTIGLIIPTYDSVFYGELAERIQQRLRARGYLGIVLSANTPEQTTEAIHSLAGRSIDGLLAGWLYPENFSFMRREQIPVLFFEAGEEISPDADYVQMDRRRTGALAARHLIAHGYTDIAFLCLWNDLEPKFSGFLQEMRAHGLPVRPEWLIHGHSYIEHGCAGMKRLLSLKHRPRAVAAANDTVAIGAMHTIRRAGLRVPDDIAVIGFDDIKEGRFLDVPLTTVSKMGSGLPERAVDALLERIENPDRPPFHVTLPPKLVIRESCGHHLPSEGDAS